jgi:pimeloyl-ACP methyl ester carboxylesterase
MADQAADLPGRTRAHVHSWLRYAAGAVALGVLLLLGAVVGAGFYLSSPALERIGAAPADLPAESVTFASGSGAQLSGWFVAGRPGGGAVVLMHGVRGNRLAMLRRARLLHSEGFAVLLFDFQAHGESSGQRITFGRLEGLDAAAAVAFVRRRLPNERIGAIGSSLGGASALLGPAPLAVDALVLESVYPDIGSAIANRIRAVLGPVVGVLAARPTAWLFEAILPPFLGMRPADLRPIDHIGKVTAPLLMMSGTIDDRTTIAETRAMFARAPEPKTLWAVEGAGHYDLEGYAPEAYRARVLAFLIERLRPTP